MTRDRLPDTREAITFKTTIDGKRKVYLTVGFYPDGRIGEVFLKMDKQGKTSRGTLDCFAIAVSWLLQEGVDAREIVDKFKYQRFEPEGRTTDKEITEDGTERPMVVTSPIDWAMKKIEQILDRGKSG
ncbi:MAG: hypothetical protein GWM98_04880 [Nitrospinaceae bacterium]|nr:hypothetical protein [Deltaproteobacteria bacterium]NIY14255.1 hypothetical protein [Nitrospinaceae bacterium]